MTKYTITLLMQNMLTECSDQVALDFRALRSTAGAEVDAAYDDFLLTTDEKEPFAVEFQSAAAELCTFCAAVTDKFCTTEDRIEATLTIGRQMPQPIFERMFKDLLKARLLAWWYKLRNQDLWQKQVLEAEAAAGRLQSLFAPSCTTRRLRYF